MEKESHERHQTSGTSDSDRGPLLEGRDVMTQVARAIAGASRVVIFSGAGISAESGISTFRAPDVGVWANKIGLAYFGTPIGWRLTPGLAWKTYLTRFRDPIARAQPNPGHYALATLEQLIEAGKKQGKEVPHHFSIITQNVDGLHQRAGSTNDLVYELHGTVYRHLCSKNRHPHPYVIDPSTLDESYDVKEDDFFSHEWKKMPLCPVEGCGSYLRPDAVLFMESLPGEAWMPAERAISKLREGDVMIVVGTSGVVYPAASLAEEATAMPGVCVIEVNPEESQLTPRVDIFLKGPSGKVLPSLVDSVRQLWQISQQGTAGGVNNTTSENDPSDSGAEEEDHTKEGSKY